MEVVLAGPRWYWRGDGRERRTWILERCGDCSSPSSRMSREISVSSFQCDIEGAQEPDLSRELSHDKARVSSADDNSDKRDNYLLEFSEASDFSSGVRLRRYVRRDQVSKLREACEAHRALQAQLRAGRAEYRITLARARELLRILRYG